MNLRSANLSSVIVALAVLSRSDKSRANTVCELKHSAPLVLSLQPNEAVGSTAVALSSPTTAWIALTAVGSRFSRRPRTRILVGEYLMAAREWARAPIEVHSFAGRNERQLALAASESGVLVLVPMQRSILSLSLRTATTTWVIATWNPPNRSATSPRVGAYRTRWSVSWLSDRRIYFYAAQVTDTAVVAPTYANSPRRGPITQGTLTAVIPMGDGRTAAAMALHSGAVRLLSLLPGRTTVLQAQNAHCPSRCSWVATAATNDGFVSLFRMPVHHDRVLSQFWLTRATIEGISHTGATIPILDAWPVAVGLNVDAIVQLARPPIVRAIDRPIAAGDPSDLLGVAHHVSAEEQTGGESTFVSLDDHGRGLLSQIRCALASLRP